MNEDKRISDRACGKGGYKCYCCGPAPGKGRNQLRRLVRHRMKNITRKVIETAIVEGI